VISQLEEAFKVLECDIEGCHLPAKVLITEKKIFQCKDHQELYAEGNKKVAEVLKMLIQAVMNLETEWVKVEGIIWYLYSDGIKGKIDKDTRSKIKGWYEQIKLDFSLVEQRTNDLPDEATFEDFEYLHSCSKSINENKEELYAECGPAVVRDLENRFLDNITGLSNTRSSLSSGGKFQNS